MRHCCSSKIAKGVSTISALRQASDSASRKRRRGPLQVGHAKKACHSESTIRCFACTQQKKHILSYSITMLKISYTRKRLPSRTVCIDAGKISHSAEHPQHASECLYANSWRRKNGFGYWFEGGVTLIVRIGLKMSKFENDFVKNEILLRGTRGPLHQFELPPTPIRDPSSRRVLTPNFHVGQRRR